jgi:integrase
MKANITKRLVDSLPTPPAGKRLFVYDDNLVGFGVKKLPTGKATFFVEYTLPGRHPRRLTIGRFRNLTCEEARAEAKQRLAEVTKGADPAVEKQARREMPTFAGWVEEYLTSVEGKKKRPEVDAYFLRGTKPARMRTGKNAKPGQEDKRRKPQAAAAMDRWGSFPLDAISQRDVEALLQDLADKRGRILANRAYASWRSCFEAAVRAGVIRSNPAQYVRKFRENAPRQRVLTDEEMSKVLAAIDTLASQSERVLLHVLIETGCRKSEALSARWEDLDLAERLWTIPSPKAGHPQTVPLSAQTVERLMGLPRLSEWVFPGRSPDRHLTSIRSAWKDIKEAAEIEKVTVHDLRRTFGLAVARHAGLQVASRLLRHADVRITAKVYAPLGIEDLRKSLEDVTEARVLPMRKAEG